MKKNVAILVSGGGTNLQAILDAVKSGKITNAEVVYVMSNNADAYALKRAEKAGVEAESCLPRSWPWWSATGREPMPWSGHGGRAFPPWR